MQQFQRVDFRSGSFVLVEQPTLMLAPLVRAYHQELLNEVRQFEYYYLPTADGILFEEFSPYYQAIADRLVPSFSAAALDPASRHRFFIASDAVPNPLDDDELVPGLPELEALMGYSYSSEVSDRPAASTPNVTTGDRHWDLITGLLLFRPTEARWLAETYSPDALSAILNCANSLQPDAEGVTDAQRQHDQELFERNQAQIDAALKQQGHSFLLN